MKIFLKVFAAGAILFSLGCTKDPFVGPYLPFTQTLSGSNDLTGRDVLLDGRTIVACGYGAGINADEDLFIFRFDSAGNYLSRNFAGTAGNDQCWSFVHANDGGFVIAGWTDVNAPGVSNDVLIVKTDPLGNQLWSKIYTSPYNDLATHITALNDGYIVAAIKGAAADENSWILRLDNNGDTLWTFTYGGNMNDGAMSVCDNGDNTFAVTGYTNSSGNGSTDGYLMTLNDNGELLNYFPFGTPGYEEPHDIAHTGNGWIICGHAGTTDITTHNVFLQFIGANGEIGKFLTYGGASHDGAEAMSVYNNRIYIAGRSSSQDPGQDIIYVVTDMQGNQLTKEWMGTPQEDSGFGIYVDQEQVVFAGYTVNTTTGRRDLFVLRK